MKRTQIPHDFVLEALDRLNPSTRPMFGCTAVYVGLQIVCVLREKEVHIKDNGVWLATSHEHHESLKKDLSSMRTIYLLGKEPTGWQNLPSNSPDFESDVLKACEFILKKDPRIGKIPKTKKQSNKKNSKVKSVKNDAKLTKKQPGT